ncbi:MAG: hypothetical protein KC438_03840 [Thermomicrobiales bacterium]|nr:hypothetical protein [Thermomicrobiales bacterium]MCO5222362.1 hypothetical protein [Thermomicrobiales bacterium]
MKLVLRLTLVTIIVIGGVAWRADELTTSPRLINASLATDNSDSPAPPRIPEDFTWEGNYVVPDLGIEVPFIWTGNGGNFQMTAGGAGDPIHFTNLIFAGELYTLTYTWSGVPKMPCSHVGAFTLDDLNEGFAEASFVGKETLHRDSDYEVNHFRSVGVLELSQDLLGAAADGIPIRVPLMAGDIYVDAGNSEQIRQLLHFGLQNLYDPNLDEWIFIEQSSTASGDVTLPDECTTE